MEQDWMLIFCRKFSAFFGPDNQPLAGIFLSVNLMSGKFFISVFGRVCHSLNLLEESLLNCFTFQTYSSGTFATIEQFTSICYDTFGDRTKLPCLGYNNPSKDANFSSSKFSEGCAIFCQSESQTVCDWCSVPSSILDTPNREEVQIKTENAGFADTTQPDAKEPDSLDVFKEDPTEFLVEEDPSDNDDGDAEYVVDDLNFMPPAATFRERNYVILREYQVMQDSLTCTLCPEAQLFPSWAKLRKHLGRDHQAECFQCARCPLKFKNLEGVSRHSKNVHFYGQFSCLPCGKVSKARAKAACFSYATDLVDHMLERHFYQSQGRQYRYHKTNY